MTKTLKIFFFSFFLLVGFLFFQDVKAEVFTQNVLDTADIRTQLTGAYQNINRGFNTSTNAVEYIALSFETNKNCLVKARLGFDTGYSGTCLNKYIYSENQATNAGEEKVFEFDIPTDDPCNQIAKLTNINVVLSDGEDDCTGSGNYAGTWYGSNSSSSWPYGSYSASGVVSLQDLYFLIIDTEGVVFNNTSAISFDPPLDAYQCDFQNWSTKFNLGFTDTQTVKENGDIVGIEVHYGLSPGVFAWRDFAGFDVIWGQEQAIVNDTYGLVWKSGDLGDDPYPFYAQACICKYFDDELCDYALYPENFLICSDVKEFIKNPYCTSTEKQWTQGPFVTSSSQTGDNLLDCESIEGTITQGFCKVLKFLFVPNSKSMENFSTLKTKLQTKPPFGYISIYSNAFSGFATTTTSTVTDSNFSEVMKTVSSLTIIDTIFNIVKWIFWLLFGYYIYIRFKHFSLHG